MRVRIMQADDSGCGLYRCALPARAVRQWATDTGAANAVTVTLGSSVRAETLGSGRIQRVLEDPFDVLVLQRPVNAEHVHLAEWARRTGVAVVAEIDDDLERVDPRNAFAQDPAAVRAHVKNLRAVCAIADKVTVSTPALLHYGGRGAESRGVVIRNRVASELAFGERRDDTNQSAVVAWPGSSYSHPGDLDVLRGAPAEAAAPHGAALWNIGPGGLEVQRALAAGSDLSVQSTGWLSLEDYQRALLLVRVGLAPLADNRFNHAKSELKIIELAAAGAAVVASPATPEYARAIRLGLALPAYRRRDWVRHVDLLLRDRSYWLEHTTIVRETAQRDHVADSSTGAEWAAAWWSALESATSHRVSVMVH